MLTKDQARAALKALEISRGDLADRLGDLTGKKYGVHTVNAWFAPKGRAVPDAVQVYLQMEMRRRRVVLAEI
jgi:hypothetical protein